MPHLGRNSPLSSRLIMSCRGPTLQCCRPFQIAALETATKIEDMDIPGFRLHLLKGQRKGLWSISVSGNWRITFEFQDGNAYVVNYEDYH